MNGSSLMAGGEAGKEAVLPLKGFYDQLEHILSSRMNTGKMEQYLAVIANNSSKGIYLEDGTLVGHLIPAIDSRLGQAQKLNRRLSFMIPDVKLNGKSVREMGWIRENIDFPTPQSQTNTIVVPGRNSPIRYTEALGRVSYQPRSFTIVLSMLGTRKQYDQKVSELVNQYAGKLIKVIRSEEPMYMHLGL